jgi:lipopolysaccharide transport system ATP-binding protein
MSNIAIRVENLGKEYQIGGPRERYQTLRDSVMAFAKSPFRRLQAPSTKIWALRDVSFEIKQGEAVGIIGRNGAGKSTVLKVLSRITEPTEGRVRLKGRVASLLEVGTGFHPELTGRENIFLNGAILGMTKAEIKARFDEIVDFAETAKFLDTPVKRYSSGMYVRLAFAVAAHLEPEILLVDEVLAVGDAQFQKKCLGKMEDVSVREGRTVLFVSHNLAAIKSLCSTAILLNKGNVEVLGGVSDVVQHYFFTGIKHDEKPNIDGYRTRDVFNSPAIIDDVFVKGYEDQVPTLNMSDSAVIVIRIHANRRIRDANVSLGFHNSEGIATDIAFSWDDGFYLNIEEGNHEIEFRNDNLSLSPNKYTIGVGLNQSDRTVAWDVISHYPIFAIENRNDVKHWDFRPWAIHHLNKNTWKIRRVI